MNSVGGCGISSEVSSFIRYVYTHTHTHRGRGMGKVEDHCVSSLYTRELLFFSLPKLFSILTLKVCRKVNRPISKCKLAQTLFSYGKNKAQTYKFCSWEGSAIAFHYLAINTFQGKLQFPHWLVKNVGKSSSSRYPQSNRFAKPVLSSRNLR